MQKILLADDDPVVLKYLSILLQKHDYHCLIATNGIEAIEKVATYSPDLILLDVKMPEKIGRASCRERVCTTV